MFVITFNLAIKLCFKISARPEKDRKDEVQWFSHSLKNTTKVQRWIDGDRDGENGSQSALQCDTKNGKWCLDSSFSSLTENSKCSKKLVHYITCITLPAIVDHQVCQPLIFISLLAGSVRPNNILSYTVGHQSTWHSENL